MLRISPTLSARPGPGQQRQQAFLFTLRAFQPGFQIYETVSHILGASIFADHFSQKLDPVESVKEFCLRDSYRQG